MLTGPPPKTTGNQCWLYEGLYMQCLSSSMAKQIPSKERRKKRTLKRPCGANELGQWVKPKRPLGDRARYCETCKQVRKDGPRHKFDNPSHKLRKLTPEEKAQFPSPPQTGEYVFNFGKRKKKTLAWVKERHPSYFPRLIRESLPQPGRPEGSSAQS